MLQLLAHASAHRQQVASVLMRYVREDRILHGRNFLVAELARFAQPGTPSATSSPGRLATAETAGGEAPVYYARHGEGRWDFEQYANTFLGFLQQLT